MHDLRDDVRVLGVIVIQEVLDPRYVRGKEAREKQPQLLAEVIELFQALRVRMLKLLALSRQGELQRDHNLELLDELVVEVQHLHLHLLLLLGWVVVIQVQYHDLGQALDRYVSVLLFIQEHQDNLNEVSQENVGKRDPAQETVERVQCGLHEGWLHLRLILQIRCRHQEA